MNKLNNVGRGEYPWCAETAEALNSTADFVKRALGGLSIQRNRTAVVLSGKEPPYYMYISGSTIAENNVFCKVTTKIPASDPDYPTLDKILNMIGVYALRNISKFISINKQNDPDNSYADVILEEEYEIVKDMGYSFVELRDIIETTRKSYINLNNIILPEGLTLDIANSLAWKNPCENRFELHLRLNHTASFLGAIAIEIPLELNRNGGGFFERPISAIVGNFTNGDTDVLPAYIRMSGRNKFIITLNYAMVTINATPQNTTIIHGVFETIDRML